MDCSFVKRVDLICFTFNPDRSTLFYLIEKGTELHIIEENLYTGMVINRFIVPARQKRLDADNYILSYNRKLKALILTVSCRLLIYSLTERTLVFVSETGGRNPYFITSVTMSDNAPVLFFSASQQRNVYCINLEDCILNAAITNFTKLKVPPKVEITDIKAFDNKLVAACNDRVLRIWNTNSFTSLKGVGMEHNDVGEITALGFSKDGGKFMAATERGAIYVWDGKSMGSNNILILSQKITDKRILSVCWFHYSGQYQSRRFIILTADGNVKLFAFVLEKALVEGKQAIRGKAVELCSIFQLKEQLSQSYVHVNCHSYSNHVCFNPGRVLCLVDYNPVLYYPVVAPQYTHSFQSLVPTQKNQIFWQRELFFIDGLEIKRLKEGVQKKLSLNSVLEYQGLKILKMEARPLTLIPFRKVKFLLSYHLGNVPRVLLIFNVNLEDKSDVIEFYKEYPSSMGMFLGPTELPDPLILLLNEDRQSVSVMLNYDKEDKQALFSKLSDEQKPLFSSSLGQLLNVNLQIKIQKVYRTPLRQGYAVLYRSENILRFSKNMIKENGILDLEILHKPQLRVDYSDIIIDVVWCSQGNLGAVVCLDKVIFINENLEQLRVMPIDGSVTQARFQGYTLFVTTKTDFYYFTLQGATPIYSIQNIEEKYIVCMIMADRVITASRPNIKKKDKQAVLDFRTRYLNLMQPLISGYLSYSKNIINQPPNAATLKKVVECLVPYHKVSERFIRQLNDSSLCSLSNYFIQLNPSVYELDVKMHTLFSQIGLQILLATIWKSKAFKMKDFWKSSLYQREKSVLINIYHYIQALTDKQYPNIPEHYLTKICALESSIRDNKKIIQDITKVANAAPALGQTISIVTSFGQKPLHQNYRDYLNGEHVNMTIQAFQVDSVGQWIGLFSNFVEAKLSVNNNNDALEVQGQNEQNDAFEEAEGEFNDLVAYYRFDEGKGDAVEDLSDYGNNAQIVSVDEQTWMPLEDNDPLEVEDKWGKKCPPQFAINVNRTHFIQRNKATKFRSMNKFTIEIWVKVRVPSGVLASFGDKTQIAITNGEVGLVLEGQPIRFEVQKDTQGGIETVLPSPQIQVGEWTHLCVQYEQETNRAYIMLNCMNRFEGIVCGIFTLPFAKPFRLGSDSFDGLVTEIRIWKSRLSVNEIKDCFRSPLSIVAEKRKKLKMKIRQKPQADKSSEGFGTFSKKESNKSGGFEGTLDWGFPL